jgi:hypothetical protein
MTKITKCRLIIEGMTFLGIPTEKFLTLKNELGGTDKLYSWIESKLS